MKLGIVGLGNWGAKSAREAVELLKNNIIEDLYLCDLDETRLEEFSDYNTTTNLDEMISKVDGIHICTANANHHSLGKKILEMNKHVLIEKPLTTKKTHAFELLEIASKNDLVIQVGHIFRFANVTKRLEELNKKNFFGEIYHMNLEWTHYMKPMKNTCVLWDLLPHPLDILNFINRAWPSQISGIRKNIRQNEVEDMTFLQAEYESGLSACINLSWLNPIKRRRVEIIGSERSAVAECVKQTLKIYENDGTTNDIPIVSNNTIKEELENFVESTKSGKNRYNSGLIGLRTVELIEMLKSGRKC